MLITYNICNFCGNQNEIEEGDNQFRIAFDIQLIFEFVKKGNRYPIKDNVGTFCDKECMISYFQDFMKSNGEMIKRNEEDDQRD